MEYGLQLYSIRDLMKADTEKALEAVAKVGYRKVEFAGFFDHSAGQIRTWLDRYGLRVCGTHTGLAELTPDRIEETIAYHRAIGNTRIIVPGADYSSRAKLQALVDALNFAQPVLTKAGISLGYHNHFNEFLPLYDDGYITHTELWNRTSIFFEIDTFWAYVAGQDPVALLEKEKDRVPVIHLKDGDLCHRGLSLGQGTAPVKAVYDTARRLGMEMVVESEGQDPDGISEVSRCFAFLTAAEQS